jgi:hypothetical protein
LTSTDVCWFPSRLLYFSAALPALADWRPAARQPAEILALVEVGERRRRQPQQMSQPTAPGNDDKPPQSAAAPLPA